MKLPPNKAMQRTWLRHAAGRHGVRPTWRGVSAVTVHDQLAVLREIDALLRRARMRYWVRGGWAIDFLMGRIRVHHADIDLVTWSRHALRLRDLLEEAAYEFVSTRQPVRQFDFVKHGVDLSFVFIRRDADGVIRSPGTPDWVWPEDALLHAPCTLAGLRVRPLPPHLLLAEKLGYQEAMGRPLRPKDHRSIRLLRKLVNIEEGTGRRELRPNSPQQRTALRAAAERYR